MNTTAWPKMTDELRNRLIKATPELRENVLAWMRAYRQAEHDAFNGPDAPEHWHPGMAPPMPEDVYTFMTAPA